MPKIDIVNAKNIIESNPEKAFFKLKNTGGPKGDTGEQGPQGPKGDTGAQGPAGASASVTVGSTTTLSPGADATVTNSGDTRNAILNFGIPTGARGPQGVQGPKGDTGPMGQTGAKGDTGAAATVQVGNTNTGAPGTNAQVTNAGNEHFAVFNFTIPRGDKGEKGATGAQGQKGDKGDKGDTGAAATITVGSTTTTNPGTSATVTNSGTTSAAVLNFGIPRGATGSVKSEVVSELPETGEGDTFYLVNREATTQTATGKTINFTNNDNSGDITDAQIDGETNQNGTPAPGAPVAVKTVTGDNVVKICGKNLAKTTDGSYAWSPAGQTWEVSNGTITTTRTNQEYQGGALALNAGTTRQWAGGGIDAHLTSDGGQYTVSMSRIGSVSPKTGASATLYLYVAIFDKSGTSRQVLVTNLANSTTGSYTINLGENEHIGDILLYSQYISYSNITINIQIESGSTATTYEPYQGQSYEVNLDIGGGKNLLKYSWPYTTGYYDGSGNWSSDGRFACYDKYFEVEPSTPYSFSSSHSNTNMAILWFDENKNWISRTATTDATSASGASPATAKYARLQVRYETNTIMSYGILSLMSLQFEQGSVSSYEPFVCYELCGLGDDGAGGYLYRDGIYKNLTDNKWYVHKEVGKYQLDGTIDWYVNGTNNYQCSLGGNNRIYLAASNSGFSNCFPISNSSTGLNMYPILQGSTDYIRITNATSRWASTDLFKTFLTNNAVYLYYPLAESAQADTEITNSTLITKLDNLASAALYSGINNIFTVTPNEVPTLEIDYVTYDKYNQNKVYIWNDTLQQWQIIVQ